MRAGAGADAVRVRGRGRVRVRLAELPLLVVHLILQLVRRDDLLPQLRLGASTFK
jgi:hypothetical protein